MENIVVVGASLAGLSAVRELRAEGFSGSITVIGDEQIRPYDRPPLSKQIITGKLTASEISLESPDEELSAEWRLGVTATALDLAGKRVALDSGESLTFDGLVIATGARPRQMPGSKLRGVFTLRTLAEAEELRHTLTEGTPRVVIVGGGFIGAELAASCRSLGLEVSVIEAGPTPMGAVLGDVIGSGLAALHRNNGVNLLLGLGVEELIGETEVRGIRMLDGSTIEADIVVLAIGVVPSTDWLVGSGLKMDNGVVCDASCLAAPDVVAAGDVARWPNQLSGEFRRVEHWDNAIRQGEHAARRLLAGSDDEKILAYEPVPWVWSDQYDRKFQIVGSPAGHDEVRLVQGTEHDERFIALYRKDRHVSAVFGSNQTRKVLAYRKRIQDRLLWADALAELDQAPQPASV
ncbi:NAD(P)/FAD-dependent oxidoreductase [Arthrobacter sp. P2b]|uniref:NAD(P)/FAD-dependent oxidoreductase n=1 Tax=Arthrobacter sp. P2b TaxID=1938741 RepID=UPI0009CCFE95|nr:FAD-dependent oxidoreductase [Arthrobacter sp. P2b]SLK10544.1 Reductase C-terminal [Arthrobacter sp. P2b]